MRPCNIALSSNRTGLVYNSTLLASVMRRTKRNVHVKFYTQGFHEESFETGRLRVEFIPVHDPVEGQYPKHVPNAVFDRLRVIKDASEWDRCLILDHDMVVLCDLGDYFDEEFEGNMLMGRHFGKGIDLNYAMETWRRSKLPADWAHAGSHPFFYMGPMMNLEAMRREGTWEKLLEAHSAIHAEEQIALTAVTGGLTKPVDRKWNLIPPEDCPPTGIPSGIVHWSGWPKPWFPSSQLWRTDVWEAESTSWEALRRGEWEKPLAWEFSPKPDDVFELGKRGWKAVAFVESDTVFRKIAKDATQDIEAVNLGKQSLAPELLAKRISPSSHGNGATKSPHFVRMKSLKVAKLLAEAGISAPYIAIRGPVAAGAPKSLKILGYHAFSVVNRDDYGKGGPAAEALEYGPLEDFTGLKAGYELHATRIP